MTMENPSEGIPGQQKPQMPPLAIGTIAGFILTMSWAIALLCNLVTSYGSPSAAEIGFYFRAMAIMFLVWSLLVTLIVWGWRKQRHLTIALLVLGGIALVIAIGYLAYLFAIGGID